MKLRVSDVLDVPLRGQVLRLKVTEGTPQAEAVAVGRKLRLISPAGGACDVRIVDHSITGGKVTQQRFERVKELDVLIRPEDPETARVAVDFGYLAEPIAD